MNDIKYMVETVLKSSTINGIKTETIEAISYKEKEGRKYKTITILERKTKMVPNVVKERRSLKRFGLASGKDNHNVTTIGPEVFIEKYPYKPITIGLDRSPKVFTEPTRKPQSTRKWGKGVDRKGKINAEISGPKKSYSSFLKNKRESGGIGNDGSSNANTTLYINNIPYDITKREAFLFIEEKTSRQPSRIHVFTNKRTGEPTGSMVVTFSTRETAKKAIKSLNGERWGHQILIAQFSKPRK